MRIALGLAFLALTACSTPSSRPDLDSPAPVMMHVYEVPSIPASHVDLRELRAAVAEVALKAGRRIVVAPGVEGAVEESLIQRTWRGAIRGIAREAGCDIDEIAGGMLVLTRSSVLTTLSGETIVRKPPLGILIGEARESKEPGSEAGGRLVTTLLRLRNRTTAEACLASQRIGAFSVRMRSYLDYLVYLDRMRPGRRFADPVDRFPLLGELRAIIAATPENRDSVQYDAETNTILIRATSPVTERLRTIIEAADRLPAPIELQAIRWPREYRGARCLINGLVHRPGEAVKDERGCPIPGLILVGASRGRAFFRHDEDYYTQALDDRLP